MFFYSKAVSVSSDNTSDDEEELTFEELYLHFYYDFLAQRTAREVDFVDKIHSFSQGDKILDISCGYGRHSLELGKRHPDVQV